MPPPALQDALLHWFAQHGRDLPWRRTYLPYHIWVSEIMLQQTQMDRVVVYFNRWLDRFPDIANLAEAREQEVLLLWEGLGYYSRARNLLKTANLLCRRHGGVLPEDHGALLKLPGFRARIVLASLMAPWSATSLSVLRTSSTWVGNTVVSILGPLSFTKRCSGSIFP